MSNASRDRLPTNPFATRFTRPGVLRPLDQSGRPVDAAGYLGRLAPGRIVAIEGPHGHGKSTLLAAIIASARAAGWATIAVRVRSMGDSWRPIVTAMMAPRGSLVACDGWERAAPGTAGLVAAAAAARGVRVVVTTHRPAGLRLLARCETSPQLLAHVVAQLPDHGRLISAADLNEAFDRHAGNIREALYDLYDRFERRARAGRARAVSDGPRVPAAGRRGESEPPHGIAAARM